MNGTEVPAGGPPEGPSGSRPGTEGTPQDARLFTRIVSSLGLLVVLAVVGITFWQVRAQREATGVDRKRVLAPFTLTERSGRTVSERDLRGQVLVVNFIFTGCSYSCFQISQRMTEVQDASRDLAGVRLVSLSLDPRSDSPEALADFARRLKADPDRWWFLTGDKEVLYSLIETSFLAKATAPLDPREAPSVIPGGFDRPERIAVVDASGRVRRFVNGMRRDAAAEVMQSVRQLHKEASL